MRPDVVRCVHEYVAQLILQVLCMITTVQSKSSSSSSSYTTSIIHHTVGYTFIVPYYTMNTQRRRPNWTFRQETTGPSKIQNSVVLMSVQRDLWL